MIFSFKKSSFLLVCDIIYDFDVKEMIKTEELLIDSNENFDFNQVLFTN